jgi:hypothetical protein
MKKIIVLAASVAVLAALVGHIPIYMCRACNG